MFLLAACLAAGRSATAQTGAWLAVQLGMLGFVLWRRVYLVPRKLLLAVLVLMAELIATGSSLVLQPATAIVVAFAANNAGTLLSVVDDLVQLVLKYVEATHKLARKCSRRGVSGVVRLAVHKAVLQANSDEDAGAVSSATHLVSESSLKQPERPVSEVDEREETRAAAALQLPGECDS